MGLKGVEENSELRQATLWKVKAPILREHPTSMNFRRKKKVYITMSQFTEFGDVSSNSDRVVSFQTSDKEETLV